MTSKTMNRILFEHMSDAEREAYLEYNNLEVAGYSEYGSDGKPRYVELRAPLPCRSKQFISVKALSMIRPSQQLGSSTQVTCVKSSLWPQSVQMFGIGPWVWHRDQPTFGRK